MKYSIRQAVVIGAGTMGAAIAAHLANAGVKISLLDIAPDQLTPEEQKKGLTLQDRAVRNRIAREGLDRAREAKPANFFSADTARLISVGNLEDDFQAVAEADWVIEAIVENLEIKRRLMERVDAVRGARTIVSTNTSGLPVKSIKEGRSEQFRQHFLGTHFFNPPRYLKLLEIIPTSDTLPEVLEAISHFGEYRLGKGIVLAKDTPNFIANRLAFGTGAFALDYILEQGYTVDEVDAITGPVMGRPKTATFRLMDLVGIDVWDHVGKNLAPAIPHDEHALRYLKSESVNRLIETLVQRGALGNKNKQGFYKEVRQDGKKEFWPLDLQTLDYQPPAKVRFNSIEKAKDLEKPLDRLKVMLAAEDRAGQLAKALTYQGLAYASERIPEIANTPDPIDCAMVWGFGHEAGPFETWDSLGVAGTLRAMEEAGFPAAGWVQEMLTLGVETFYCYDGSRRTGVYSPQEKSYVPIRSGRGLIFLNALKQAGKIISRNTSASLVDLGDGVACVEFHTKMNALDEDLFTIIGEAGKHLDADFEGLVIGNEAANFSAGANLFTVVLAAQNGMWEQLDRMIRGMQGALMELRYSPRPIVVAPAGMALGGGAEIIMHGSRVVAGAELYSGLVEVGAGVIPSGGGTKEMMRRLLNPPMRTPDVDPLPFVQRLFEQIGMGKVSTSAVEARDMGILNPCDRIVMNRDHLLAEAKKEVLHLIDSGYTPPLPEEIYAGGRDLLAALRVGLFAMKDAGYLAEYGAHIGGKLAYVLSGGELSRPTWVSEQYILDLEREAFLSLCGEEKTRQMMWHILQTGKPLRI